MNCNLSLDIMEMIRGNIKVNRFRLENGFVRLEVYPDSLFNFEKALGILLGESNPGEQKKLQIPPGGLMWIKSNWSISWLSTMIITRASG